VTPGGLQPVDAADAAEGDDDLDEVELADLTLDAMTWTGRRRLGSSRVSDLVVGDWHARAASLVDSVLERLDIVALSAVESGWWNVEVQQSRIGSAQLHGSTLRNVHFVRCKLGYLNLRGANLTDIAFTDCIISDLDLMRATATRVSFAGTRITRLELSGSRLEDVDLRGAALTDIGTLEGLRGATITLDQLLELAPALSESLGIKVE
jgi:uncharacterized protein YjbI with pentapeptide repeats